MLESILKGKWKKIFDFQDFTFVLPEKNEEYLNDLLAKEEIEEMEKREAKIKEEKSNEKRKTKACKRKGSENEKSK